MFDLEPFHNNPTLTLCDSCKYKPTCLSKGKCLLKSAHSFTEKYHSMLSLFNESPAGNIELARYKTNPKTGERVQVTEVKDKAVAKKLDTQKSWTPSKVKDDKIRKKITEGELSKKEVPQMDKPLPSQGGTTSTGQHNKFKPEVPEGGKVRSTTKNRPSVTPKTQSKLKEKAGELYDLFRGQAKGTLSSEDLEKLEGVVKRLADRRGISRAKAIGMLKKVARLRK